MSERSGFDRNRPFVSIVLSFFNEEAIIPELLRRLRAVMEGESKRGTIARYELIFVNDRSTDASERLLRREVDTAGDVVLINMSRNFGVSECVFAGLRYARGDAVIYMDADLQDPPEVIPELIAAWQQDDTVDVVFTTRRTRSGEDPLKLLLTKYGYRLINAISDIELPVDSGDFKLLSRRVVDELLKIEEKRPYVRGLISWLGFKQVQVFYDRQSRFDGRQATKFPVLSRRTIWGYLDRALISFSDVPLKFSLFIGFIMSCLSGFYLCIVLLQKVMGWYEPGWPAIMATMLLLGGVQLMVVGVVGLYVNIIFIEVKRRPNYVIDTVIRKAEEGVLDMGRPLSAGVEVLVPGRASSEERAGVGGRTGH
jgi:polyisoprenyl-phosphate glycosyltransferase